MRVITQSRYEFGRGGGYQRGSDVAGGILSSNGTTFDNTGGTMTATDTAVSITHTGAVQIGAQLSSGSGAMTIDSSGSTVTLDAAVLVSSGTVSVDSSAGTTATVNGSVSATGAAAVRFGLSRAGVLQTAGDVTTVAGAVRFYRGVTLTDDIAVSTTSGVAGNIQFDSTIDGGFDLGLTAGTGSVLFGERLGEVRNLKTSW
jgi:hypothetical protein